MYILVVSYFFLNLFVGVMFNSFSRAINLEKKKGIGDNNAAQRYFDYLTQIEQAKPEFSTFKLPEDDLRKNLYIFVTYGNYFNNFIMIVIILNMLTMAMNYDGSPLIYNQILDIINLIFTSIFIIECILKVVANGFAGYIYYGWNKFDCFVVVCSIVDLVLSNSINSNTTFLKSFQIIRVLRVLRVTR